MAVDFWQAIEADAPAPRRWRILLVIAFGTIIAISLWLVMSSERNAIFWACDARAMDLFNAEQTPTGLPSWTLARENAADDDCMELHGFSFYPDGAEQCTRDRIPYCYERRPFAF